MLLATQLEMEKMKVEQERKKAILVQEAAKEKVSKPDICVQFYWDYPYSAGFLESETVASSKVGLEQCSIYWEPRHCELLFFFIVPAFYFHWNKCFCEMRWSKSLLYLSWEKIKYRYWLF